MKIWIIDENENSQTYLIASEKAFRISEQPKNTDIQQLIQNNNLSNVKSIPYKELKEIVLIDTTNTLQLNYKDAKKNDKEFILTESIYTEIRSYLKNNLKGVQLKNYSVLKQVTSQLLILFIASVLSVVTYITATNIEAGKTINFSGRRAWLKKLIATIAEMLGSTGSLIVGTLLVGGISYLVIKKIQNPLKGEVLKISKSPQLSIH